MADFAGALIGVPTAHITGRNAPPQFAYPNGNYASQQALGDFAGGTYTFYPSAPTPINVNQIVGREWTESTPGAEWFERVHVTPRTKIDFGLVVTSVTSEYELFNAYRKTVSSFNSVTNNAGAGVTLPNLATPPVGLDPFTSLLDPTTTRLSPVKLVISVGPDGPPTFDSSIDFVFGPGGTLSIFIAGQRIALIPTPYETPVRETMAFLTDIIEAVDGSEQRLALRKNPRQGLEVTYLLDAEERQRLQNLLLGWQSSAFAVPIWHEQLYLDSSASAAATSVNVSGVDDVDLRIGGLAVVYESPTKYDVIVISSKTSSTISFTTTPLVNSYSAGASVVPVRTAFITNTVSGTRYPVNLEEFRIQFEVFENDTGALVESTTGWNTYNGKILLDDCNIIDGNTKPFSLQQRILRIDNQTGIVTQASRWDVNKRIHEKGFSAGTRAEVLKLKKLLLALRGKQKSFWLPTFISDLTVKANLTAGGNTMDIEHVGYTRFVQNRASKNVVRVTFTDATSETKTITGSTQIDTSTERLTVGSTWGSLKTPAEISRVEFFELTRFDTDEFVLTFERPAQADVFAPVKVVTA